MTTSRSDRWPAGRLLGPQLGATAWMLAATVVTAMGSPRAALLCAAAFVVATLVALGLVAARRRIAFPAALSVALVADLVLGITLMLALEQLGHWDRIARVGGGFTARQSAILLVAITAGVLLVLWWTSRRDSRQ